jgi:hypothetical protein
MTRQEKEIEIFKGYYPEIYQLVVEEIKNSDSLDFEFEALCHGDIYPRDIIMALVMLGWRNSNFTEINDYDWFRFYAKS